MTTRPDSTMIPAGGLAPDRRSQERISVEIPVTLKTRDLAIPIRGIIKNLSWGGALIVLSRSLPPETCVAQVSIPWKRDVGITANAQILRTKQLQDAHTLVAIRFLSLSPRSNLLLESLLETLGSTGPSRTSKNLAYELEIQVSDTEELRHMVATIATGHYACTVSEAYAKDQSICFTLGVKNERTGVRLRARVVEVRQTTPAGHVGDLRYHLTLKFEHPRRKLAQLMDYLLDQLRKYGDTAKMLDAVKKAQSQLLKSLSLKGTVSALGRSIAIRLRSTLEVDFPEALQYLTLAWGDAEAFDVTFHNLTIRDLCQIGAAGWPPDAWEELTLLQDVHDCAYGVTREREIFARFFSPK